VFETPSETDQSIQHVFDLFNTNPKSKKSNPATAFLTMAGFNVLAALIFLTLYLVYASNDNSDSVYFLVASAIAIVSAGGALVAYGMFKKKFEKPGD
jgi:hypothetical protein